MAKRWMAALAAALLAQAATPVLAQDRPPPGCRWQNGEGGVILACKDAKGYWRRSGDDEIVGYDPPPRPKPAAAAKPAPTPAPPAPAVEAAVPVVQPEAASATPAPVETPNAAPAPAASPPAAHEPPTQPQPPMTPLEAFFHWLLELWRSLSNWVAGLF